MSTKGSDLYIYGMLYQLSFPVFNKVCMVTRSELSSDKGYLCDSVRT